MGPSSAQTPFFHQGVDAKHAPNSALPNEQVDPASGTLTVVATDLVLPGNAGFTLAVQRVYNSSVYPDYDSGSTAYEEDSWAGIGWRLHFGRILHADSQSAGQMQVEMGDGSRHPLYHSLDNPNIWITPDFWLYNPADHTLQLPNGQVYTFDRAVTLNERLGLVRYVTDIHDPFQNHITFTYFDASGPPDGIAQIHQTLSNLEARDITFTYDATFKAVASMTYLNHTWNYDHAASGPAGYSVLYRVRPPLGSPTNYEYNGGELTAIVAPFGGRIAYTYADAVRRASTLSTTTRVVTARTMSGHDVPTGTWTFAYSTGANQDTSVITAPCGGTTSYRFDGTGVSGNFTGWRAGTLAEITVVDGGVTLDHRTMSWNPSETISNDPVSGSNGVWSDTVVRRPLLTQQTTSRGSRTWTTNYSYHSGQGNINDYGHPYLIEEVGETIYQKRSTTHTFQYGFTPYLLGRIASETIHQDSAFQQSDGTTASSWTYDLSTGFLTGQTLHGITTTFEPRTDGNVNAVVDGRGNRSTLTYDWGVVSSIHTPNLDTTYVVSPEGLVTSEARGSVTTTYDYDAALRLAGVHPPAANVVTYTYDDLHGTYVRVSHGGSIVEHDVDAFGREFRAFNSQGLQSGLIRDSCGRVTNTSEPYTTLPLTPGTTVQYDALGRVTRVTDPAGKVTTYATDGLNVTRTDANNHATLFEYMAFGDPANANLVTVTDPQANVTRYRYDVSGALTSVAGPAAGLQRTWTLESHGLVGTDTQPESGTTTYTYDEAGNLKTVADANSQTTTFTYDGNNRLTFRDASGTAEDLTITYDTSGRVASLSVPGTTTTLTYDVPNRKVTRTDTTAAGTFSSVYVNDADGNLSGLTYPSGRIVSYTYDAEDRLTAVNHQPPGASQSSPFASAFTYDEGGRLAAYTTGAVTHGFTYDAARLKRITTTGGVGGSLDLTYGYDNVGNVTSITDPRPNATQRFVPDPLDRLQIATGPWGSLTWSYDAAGNRLTETSSAQTTYTYNAAQRLTNTSGGANESFTYDNVGRLIGDAVGSYTYSPLGKLLTTTAPSVTATFSYDASGERFAKTVNGQTTYTLRSLDGRTLSEYAAACGTPVWSRDVIYAGDRILGAAKATTTRPVVSVATSTLTVAENAGTASVSFALATPGGAALGCAVTASYHTVAGTAGPGLDFTAKAGTVVFPAGSPNGATQTITVPILNDTLNEDNETVFVDLTSASGADIGASARTTVTIADDDPLPTLSISDSTVQEGNSGTTNAIFTVALSPASGRVVTVAYATLNNGTATAGSDFGAVAGTLTFPPGATSATIAVPVYGDTLYEANETFTVQISNAVNAVLVRWFGGGTIVNDDPDLPPRNTWGDMYTTRDGAADAILFDASTRLWTFRDSSSGSLATFGPFGDTASYGDILVPADYNGDGRTDCAYYRPSTGVWTIAPSCVWANAYSVTWGGDPSDVPVPADFDGDGRADIVVYRRATNIWYIAYTTGGSTSVEFGWNWTNVIPTPGDYDGDGRADLAYYATYNSSWWILPSSAGGIWVADGTVPSATVITTAGDFDGDGHADTAYFYPATASWYVVLAASRVSTDNGGVGQWYTFGSGSMIPVSADYDGDGQTDLALYDPATSLFWIRRSTTQTVISISLPNAGTVPVLKRPQ